MPSTSPKPPFYTLGKIGVIHCNGIYILDLLQDQFGLGLMPDHTQPCELSELPRPQAVHAELLEHLSPAGYDPSSLSPLRPPET